MESSLIDRIRDGVAGKVATPLVVGSLLLPVGMAVPNNARAEDRLYGLTIQVPIRNGGISLDLENALVGVSATEGYLPSERNGFFGPTYTEGFQVVGKPFAEEKSFALNHVIQFGDELVPGIGMYGQQTLVPREHKLNPIAEGVRNVMTGYENGMLQTPIFAYNQGKNPLFQGIVNLNPGMEDFLSMNYTAASMAIANNWCGGNGRWRQFRRFLRNSGYDANIIWKFWRDTQDFYSSLSDAGKDAFNALNNKRAERRAIREWRRTGSWSGDPGDGGGDTGGGIGDDD